MITVVGISGSLRRGSYNSSVLRAAASTMPEGSELRIASIAEIPLYNGDEAMHWAVLRQALGEDPVPSAFV